MSLHLVFSLLGQDRTGLVDRLSGVVAAHGGNLEEARMAVLGGEFAVMMLVRTDAARRAQLEQAVREVAEELQMMALVKETTVAHDTNVLQPITVTVIGADHEGIVHPVVNWLSTQGCSIVNLESHVTAAPHTGTMLFSMTLHVDCPSALSPVDIGRSLEGIGDSLNVDVEVKAEHVPVRQGIY